MSTHVVKMRRLNNYDLELGYEDGETKPFSASACSEQKELNEDNGIVVEVLGEDTGDKRYPFRAVSSAMTNVVFHVDEISTLDLLYPKVIDRRPKGKDCPECWGTGFWKGAGRPCSRGCQPPAKLKGLAASCAPKAKKKATPQAPMPKAALSTGQLNVPIIDVTDDPDVDAQFELRKKALLGHGEDPFAIRFCASDYQVMVKDEGFRFSLMLQSQRPSTIPSYVWHMPKDVRLVDKTQPGQTSEMLILFTLAPVQIPIWLVPGAIAEQHDPLHYVHVNKADTVSVNYTLIDNQGMPQGRPIDLRTREFLWQFGPAQNFPGARKTRSGFHTGGVIPRGVPVFGSPFQIDYHQLELDALLYGQAFVGPKGRINPMDIRSWETSPSGRLIGYVVDEAEPQEIVQIRLENG